MTYINEIRSVFDRCDLMINGDLISREPLLLTQWNYLCDLAESENSFGAVLHTGSSAYNAMILFFCALLAIGNKSSDNISTIHSLEKGDKVIYTDPQGRTERYVFNGIITEYSEFHKKKIDFVRLIQEKGTGRTNERRLPKDLWSKIAPYYGESVSFDGRGLRKENKLKSEFFHTVLGIEVPNLIDASAIILCSKQYYDYLFDACSLYFKGNTIMLADIATAAFYTDSTEIPHSGNKSKSEPMLKFTSSAEFARVESRRKSGNKVCGFFALESEIISRNLSLLPQVWSFKRLPMCVSSLRIDAPVWDELEKPSDKTVSYFACTKQFLKRFENTMVLSNKQTEELQKQINMSVHQKTESIVIKDIFQKTKYFDLLKTINTIKNDEYQSSEKEAFILNSYSLLKLMISAIFPLSYLSTLIDEKKIDIDSYNIRIDKLGIQKELFPAYLKRKAEDVIEGLREAYKSIETDNEKERQLRIILSKYQRKNVAVIVKRSYFETVLSNRSRRIMINDMGEITITTPSRFDPIKQYDGIIMTYGYSGQKINPVECISAPEIYSILYECELPYHNALRKNYIKKQRLFSGIEKDAPFDNSEYKRETEWLDNYHEYEEMGNSTKDIDKEIETFVDRINRSADISRYLHNNGTASTVVNIVAVATFENNAKAFFTKMYKAYVFDDLQSSVKEVGVESLREGDRVIFFRSSDQAKDLVSTILEQLINNHLLNESLKRNYEMSKRWKNDLKVFQNQNNLTDNQLASQLKLQGASVQEITIKQWLNEESHTVAPLDSMNLKLIGHISQDKDLEDKYMDYFNACREIRKTRIRILDYISKVIAINLTGAKPDNDLIYAQIYKDVETLGEILEISSIVKTDIQVPVNMINRPLTIRE